MKLYKNCVFMLVSLSVSGLYARAVGMILLEKDLTAFTQQLALLEGCLQADGTITLPVIAAPTTNAGQKAAASMMQLVAPLYAAIFRSGKGPTQDPDSVMGPQGTQLVAQYQKLFAAYVTTYGTSAKVYQTLQFGSLFLPLLLAKNVFKADLSNLGITSLADLSNVVVTPELLAHAQTFQKAFVAFQSFINSKPENLQSPLSLGSIPPLLVGYSSFNRYATAVLQYIRPSGTSADAVNYINTHFTDKALLAEKNVAAVTASVTLFNTKYPSNDAYFSVYQMWAAYAPLRYLELQFLSNQTANKGRMYQSLYLTVLPMLGGISVNLPAPYQSQCNQMISEFQIVYQVAKNVVNGVQQ